MEAVRYLSRDSLWALLARLGTQMLLALFTILIARRLGSHGFGDYVFLAAVVMIGNMLTTYGTDMLLIREISAHRDFSRLPAALVVQLCLSMFIIALVWLLPALPKQSLAGFWALKVYILALLPLAFFTIFTTVLRGVQRLDRYALLNLGASVMQLLLTVLFIQPGAGVIRLAWVLLVVQGLGAGLAGLLCWRAIPNFWPAKRLGWCDIRDLLRASTLMALLGGLSTTYQRLSVLLLAVWLGPAATGLFSAAQRVVEFAKTGHLAVFTALYPALAKSPANIYLFRSVWVLLLSGAGLAALGISLMAQPLIALLFGAEYVVSVAVLHILAWALIPFTISTFLTLALLARHKESVVLVALTVAMVALLGFGAVGINRGGQVGVAWALLAAETVQAGCLSWAWLKQSRGQLQDSLVLLENAAHDFSQSP